LTVAGNYIFSAIRRGKMPSIIPVKLTPRILLMLAVLILGVGFGLGRFVGGRSLEGFAQEGLTGIPRCSSCKQNASKCACGAKGMARLICPPCREPDMSKYVLKSSVPPCQACPDMTNYMLKTECPPVADLSKYVLKSSIPKQQPVIIDNSACRKDVGECPPCPRPRCPTVTCPAAPSCPAPAPCPRPVCPTTTVKCKAEPSAGGDTVRPFLAPLNMSPFGM
jgi:hypothetical protein